MPHFVESITSLCCGLTLLGSLSAVSLKILIGYFWYLSNLLSSFRDGPMVLLMLVLLPSISIRKSVKDLCSWTKTKKKCRHRLFTISNAYLPKIFVPSRKETCESRRFVSLFNYNDRSVVVSSGRIYTREKEIETKHVSKLWNVSLR